MQTFELDNIYTFAMITDRLSKTSLKAWVFLILPSEKSQTLIIIKIIRNNNNLQISTSILF